MKPPYRRRTCGFFARTRKPGPDKGRIIGQGRGSTQGLVLAQFGMAKGQPSRFRPIDSIHIASLYNLEYSLAMAVIYTTDLFDKWLEGLRDERGKSVINVRLRRVEEGHFGDCEPVGEGVSEMRIHHGPGYRVYFKRSGIEIVILLAGGDKGTQAKDIKKVLKLAREL